MRSDSVQYAPWNRIAGICCSVSPLSSLGESQLTTLSLFSSIVDACLLEGGTLEHHSLPCSTTLYFDRQSLRIFFWIF